MRQTAKRLSPHNAALRRERLKRKRAFQKLLNNGFTLEEIGTRHKITKQAVLKVMRP